MKKFIAFVFAAVLTAGAWAHQYEATVNGVKWYYNRISDGKGGYNAEITYRGSDYYSYSNEYSRSLTIPSTLGGYKVTTIGDYAFYSCRSLTSVTIPDSVTTIGGDAFYDCRLLTSVTIPDSVTSIGSEAFDGCSSLTSVTIPDSVTTIGVYAFCGCSSLKEVHITDLVKWCAISFEDNLANPCYYAHHLYLNGEEIKDLVIPDSVTSIGSSAFSGCSSLASVTIPNSVTEIGDYAFDGCSSLTSITIPESVTSIGSSAFYGTPFYNNQPDGLVILGKGFLYKYKGTCPSSVTIPDSVTTIGSNAFYGCSSLTSVTMPDSVTTIGEWAFVHCRSLTSVTIPNSVTTIGEWAFANCSSLTSITIPDSVTEIGSDTFYGCSSLKSVTIPNSVTTIGGNAFYETPFYNKQPDGFVILGKGCLYKYKGTCPSSVTIPDSVTTIGSSAFSGCRSLTSITIPNSVTSIGSSAFYECSSLKSITIPDSVTTIGSYAFDGCSSLTSVTIPDSVTEIGDYAFYGCSSLKEFVVGENNSNYRSINGLLCTKDGKRVVFGVNGDVMIPDGVTTIGSSAFYGCSSLTSVTIPDSVTEIGDYAFYNCSSLKEIIGWRPGCPTNVERIVISDSVTSIGSSAFSDCSSLTSITIPDSVTEIGGYAFYCCRLLTSVTIPNSVTTIGANAFDGCSSLTSVTIPNSVTTIGLEAFYYCSSLTSVTIPNSVTSIGANAFDGCSSLKEIIGWIPGCPTNVERIVISDSVTTIGEYAFYNCSSLTSVTIPDSVTTIGSYAFEGCSSLTSVTIPNSVTTIGLEAFYHCSSLTSITIPDSVTTIGKWAFCGCSSLTSVTIPGRFGLKTLFPDAYITSVAIADGVTEIGDYAFCDCDSLTTLTIPDSVTSIGKHAFYNCSSLTSVTVPDSVTTIGVYAFYGCSSLKEVHITDLVKWCAISFEDNLANPCYYAHHLYLNGEEIKDLVIPDSVTSIGEYAFYYCSSLTSVTIPNSVTTIESHAFSGCSSLTSVTIPNSVTTIGSGAFSVCSSLTSVTIPNSVTKIGEGAFSACSSLTSVTIPESVTTIEIGTFNSCSSLTSVTIPNGVTTIGHQAFFGCSSLALVTIPNSVTKIGYDAFFGCSSLTSVTIPNSVTTIGLEAFYGCSSLKELVLPPDSNLVPDSYWGLDTKYIIRQKDVDITVSVKDIAIVYDGLEHSLVFDLTANCKDFPLNMIEYVGESVLAMTGTGTRIVHLEDSDFEYTGSDIRFRNVTIRCCDNDSTLKVLPRKVSITSANASKIYDGTPLSPSCIISGDGFVNGECDVRSASITSVGSCKNPIVLNWAEGASASNYTLTLTEGTLTILPAKVPRIAMGAFSTTYSYDGEEHTIDVAGVESTQLIDSPRFSYALSAEGPWQDEAPTFKDAGRHSVWYKISADNYEDYIQEACVTILPRKMVIASGDAEKFYDGMPLTCSSAEVTAGGPVDGETFTLDFTGAQLDEGESQNTFDIVWDGSAKESNYEVRKDYGTLKVTRLFGDVGDDTISATYPYSYKSLTEVSFTEGVEEVLASQFYGCVSLQSVKFPDSLRVIDCHALDGLPNVEWQIVDGYKFMDGWLFGYTDDAAEELSCVDDIRGVASGALEGCKSLRRFVCAKNAKLTSICDRAFKDMYWLEEVALPDALELIGKRAFEGCTELYSISFGSRLTEVGAAAFADCISLETVSFKDGLVTLGFDAFAATVDTMRLKSVSLPSTLKEIGSGAFRKCELIRGVTAPSGIMPAKDLFPDSYRWITSFAVADGSTTMVDSMFAGCESMNAVSLPNTLTTIGDSAFAGCRALAEIGLPDSVISLGKQAFKGCVNLKTVGLSKNLDAINDETFVNCPELDSLIVPASVKSIGNNIYSGLNDVALLRAVYYLGDAPAVESAMYSGTPSDMTSYVIKGSIGWYRPGSPTLPTGGWPTSGEARVITYWQPNVFDVTFDANGGLPESYVVEQITDTTYSLPKALPKRDGYVFDGWWTERIDGARITANSRVTAKNAHTLYAHWSQRTDMVTVRFNPNGGTVSPEEVTYNLNVTYGSLPVPTRIGHTFVGWHTSPIGGTAIIEASMVDKVVNELYAHWKPITYIVRFNANGAIGQSYQQEHTYNASDKLSLNTFTKEGFVFVGWSLTPGGSADFANNQEVENLGEVQDQVVDLYAVWKAATYAVRFDGNGGAGNMANQTHDVGSSQTLSKQQFKRIGYIFSGWATTPTGNVVYGDEESVSNLTFVNNATVVLYAVWTPGSYSIVYHANDGTQSSFSESAIWDRNYVIADNRFVRDGYGFVGWAVGDDGAVAYMPMMNVRNIAEDAGDQVCLYAVWEKSAAVDPTNVVFMKGGDADWQQLSQLVAKDDGTHSVATPVVWQSGKIGDNESSVLKTKVCGKGTISFWWRVSCESFRTIKLDHLAFAVDGEEIKWINGEKDWAYFEAEITSGGEHEVVWSYNKDDEGSDGEDCGAVCAVVWTPQLSNLSDYLNADDLTIATTGSADWFGTTEVSHDGAGAAQSGKIGDNQESRLETTVDGSGTIAFWWKVDCESYRTYKLDHVAFLIDGVEQKWINGNKDWMRESFEVSGAGAHTLAWVYAKDEEGSDGEDCAWVDEIVWSPAPKPSRPEIIEGASEAVKAAFDKWADDYDVSNPRAANVNAFILGLEPTATEEAIQAKVEAELKNLDLGKLAEGDISAAVAEIQAKYPNAKVDLVPVEDLNSSAHLYRLVIKLR